MSDPLPFTPPGAAASAPDAGGRARSPVAVTVSVLAALAVLTGGLLHLRTWNADYREIPDGAVPGLWVVKTGFPLNAAASVVVAALLVAVAFGALAAWRRFVIGGALVLELGSIAALVLSRGAGIFGWTEKGYDGDPGQILAVEVVAVVLLVVTAVLWRRSEESENVR